jgi:uncharacterized protein YkwD
MILPISLKSNSSIIYTETASAETTINGFSEEEYYDRVNEMIYLLNQYRVSMGLPELLTCDTMNELARVRASEQELTDMSHTRPDESKYSTIFSEYNVSVGLSAENLFKGVYVSDAQFAMNTWKNSEGHNTNMLGNYTYVGVGTLKLGDTYYWLQLFCNSTDPSITDNAYLAEMPVETTTEATTTEATTTEATTTAETTTEATTTTETTTITQEETTTEATTNPAYNDCDFDVNKDGDVNSVDLLLLKKRILGMI